MFMEGEIEDIEEINSMRQVKELFAQMKNIYNKLLHNSKSTNFKSQVSGGKGAQGEQKDIERRKT